MARSERRQVVEPTAATKRALDELASVSSVSDLVGLEHAATSKEATGDWYARTRRVEVVGR